MDLRYCIVSLFFIPFIAYSQQTEINYISSIEDAEISDEAKATMIEDLYFMLDNPCNLNMASDYQLSIIGLSASQIQNIKEYIKSSGQIFSIYELSIINGFTEDVITKIKPFICAYPINKQPSLRFDSVFIRAKHEIRTQYREILENSYGYLREDKGYTGSKFATNFRYNFNYFDRLSFSMTAEKDAGEPFFDSLQRYGYDFYSVQLTLKHIGILEQLTLGDYLLNFAEGLTIGQFFDLGHFNNNAKIKRNSNGIQPYRSVIEYGYSRGLAAQLRIGHFDLYLFGSYNTIDYSGSILTTGYHRTMNELARKDSNSEVMLGSHLAYISKGLEVGCTWFGYGYKYPIYHQSSVYQNDYFTGRYNNITALDANYLWRKWRLFSEIAMSANQAFASILGIEYSIGYKTNIAVAYRNYAKAFQNFYSSAIGIQSNNANENGIYAAFTHRINKKLHYYIGFDYFHFPYISYRADAPVNGCKAKAEFNLEPNTTHLISVYYRFNCRPYNVKHAEGKIFPENNILNQIQVKYGSNLFYVLSVNVRCGYSFTNTYESDTNNGFFSFVEAIYEPFAKKLKINVRYAIFQTDDYDNRFSIYEYNLPLNFSTATIYDKGERFYTYVSWKITKQIEVSARYAITKYYEKKVISSGNDEIESNKRQDVGMQLHFKF